MKTLQYLTLICLALSYSILNLSCTDHEIREDRPRSIQSWVYPNDFEPSFTTEDEAGVKWSLFVSQRLSGKDNLWLVHSDGGEWVEPLILMNAYYFDSLEFTVRNDTIDMIFYDIADEYFYDYNVALDLPDFPDTTQLSFPITDLRLDRDSDGVPDKLERELLLSNRLPDSDMDGKRDDMDFCPLGKPMIHDDRFDLYVTALENLFHLDDPDKLLPTRDTAWTRYYGMYYLDEPNTQFMALPGEKELPEFQGLPIILIQARSPLYFSSKPMYGTTSGSVIPHIVLNSPRIGFFGIDAEMLIEYASSRHLREKALLSFTKEDDEWSITDIEVIED